VCIGGVQAPQASKGLQELPPEIDGASTLDAGATQDGEEFGRRQLLRPVLEQAFPGSLPLRPGLDRPRIPLPPHWILRIDLVVVQGGS